MRFKSVVFDLDGTLIDTTQSIILSLLAALKYHNIETSITENDFRFLMGLSLEETINKLVPTSHNHLKASVADYYVEHYYKEFMNLAKPYPGVLTVLDVLKKKGMKLALATAKRTYCAKQELVAAAISIYFDIVQGTDQNIPGKPDPFVLFDISKRMHIPVQEMVMVGDTGRDILFGRNAGCTTIAVTYGNWNRDRFLQENIYPDHFIDDIGELPTLLL